MSPAFGRVAVLVAAGLALAACNAAEGVGLAAAPPAPGAIAFEAIDGAPPEASARLVGRLVGEAEARRIPVVAREAGPRYRVRGYLATAGAGEAATLSYVWDVFDPERRRSVRIAGEERFSARGRDGWAGFDEAAAGRVASRSMDQIAAWLAAPRTAGPATPPLSAFASPAAAPAPPPASAPEAAGGPLIPAEPPR